MRMRVKDLRGIEKGDKHLLQFARSYLSEAFPNPNREGCPHDSALRSLAFNPTESGAKLTEHLSTCSPCFKRYGELLSEVRSQQQAKKGMSWMMVTIWAKAPPVSGETPFAAALFAAMGMGSLPRGRRPAITPPLDTNRRPNPSQPQPPTVAYSRFDLDLSALSPARGSAPTITARRVSIPQSPLSLILTLPLASPEGPYNLRLAAKVHTLWSQTAQ